MSFREIAVTIRAVNHASTEFNRIQTDAESLATRVKSLGAAIAGIGASGTAIGYIANQFGLLNDSQTRVFTSAMMVVSVMGMFMRTSAGVAVAQKVYSAATAFATVVQNSLNISFATFLALTGVGNRCDCCCSRRHVRFCEQHELGNCKRSKLQRIHR